MVYPDTSGPLSSFPPVFVGLQLDEWNVIKEPEPDSGLDPLDDVWLCVCSCGTVRRRTARSINARKFPSCKACLLDQPPVFIPTGRWPARDRELRRALEAAGF